MEKLNYEHNNMLLIVPKNKTANIKEFVKRKMKTRPVKL